MPILWPTTEPGSDVMKNSKNYKRLGFFCAICSVLFLGFWIHLSSCVFDTGGISGGSEVTCGNGILEDGEECDGLDFGGRTCESLGLGQGTLVCTKDCRIDSSGCVSSTCGDGVADHGEDCDGDDLRGKDCESLGYAGGVLSCDGECRFDTTGCYVLETCGNGELDPGEECDEGEDNSDTTPNACRTNCSLPRCGDGILDDQFGEECDDGASNSDTTPNACRTDCSLPVCGDGILDDQFGEECDGAVPSGTSCQTLGFGHGDLKCTPDCRLDTSLCSAGGVTGELCISNDDCESGNCLAENIAGWPKGCCTQDCNPSNINDCGSGNLCLSVPIMGHLCFASCQETSDCRPGYSCFPTETSGSICFPNCDDDGQCHGENCQRYSGMCTGSVSGSMNGAPCTNDSDCRGFCVAEDPDTKNPKNGYCMSPCSLSKDNCPAGNVCVDFDLGADLGACMAQCSNVGQCRANDGYKCDLPSWDPSATRKVCWEF